MSWAGLANNQTVSYNNLQNAIATTVFYQKSSFSASTQQITKAVAAASVYLNESASPFAGKASNQLVVKSDLVAVTPVNITISATFDGVFGLDIEVFVSAALPAETTIFFEWCTNTSADGNVTFTLPSTFSGSTTALANCSSFGAFSGTFASGNVTTTTGDIVNDFHVKGATLTFSTSDNTRPYLLSYPNIDNTCSSPSTVTDECVNCS
jgi:hypothetical protein